MANQRKLELLISVVTKNRREIDALLKQLNALNEAGKGFKGPELDNFARELGRAKTELSSIEGQLKSSRDGAGKTALNVTAIATSFGAVTQAVQLAAQSAQQFYSSTIGANERLNQQILASASSLSATQDVFSNAVKIEDPTEAIQALQGPLKDAIQDLETETRDLVGVTSAQVNEVFSILLQNAGQITDQSKETNDVFESTVSLSKSFVASLGTIGVPLAQARQEINSILQGTIDQNSVLAVSLGITSAQVRTWKSQGTLVDELNERLETFVAGNALAANSIAGVGSNIQDIVEIIARVTTEPLLEPVIAGLREVFEFLDKNQEAIEAFFGITVQEALNAAEVVGDELGPAFDAVADALLAALPVARDLFGFLLTGFQALAAAAGPIVTQLAEDLTVVFNLLERAGDLLQFRQANDAAQALDILTASTQALTAESDRLSAKLEELRAKQADGSISEEEAKQLAFYESQVEAVKAAIDSQIESVQGVSAANDENRDTQKALVGQLEELKEGLDASTESVDVQSKELKDLGTAYDQLSEKAAAARDSVVKGVGDPAQIERAAQELTKITSQRFELGQIDEAEALEALRTVSQNQKLSADSQIAAAAEIRKVRENASQQRLSEIQTELAATEAQLANELSTNVDAVQKVNQLRNQALQERVRANQAAIQQEQQLISGGTGNQRVLQQLEQQAAELEKTVKEAQISAANEVRKVRKNASEQRLSEIQTELAAAEVQLNDELRTNVDTVKKINQLRTQALQERVRANQSAIQQEKQLIADGTGDQQILRQLQQQAAELEVEAVKLAQQSERAIQDARIAVIEEASQDVQRIQLERRRQTFLLEAKLNQQRATNTKLTEQDIQNELAKVRAQNNKDRIDEEIQLQQQRVAVFKDASREQRAAVIELQQLEIQRIEAVQAAENVAKAIAVDAIQDQIDRTKILQDSEKTRLDLREKAEDRIKSSLSDQMNLLKSQNDAARAVSSLREQLAGAELDDTREALKLRRELESEDVSDERKQEIEARLKVIGEAKTTEKELEEQLLEAQRQRNIEQFNALQARQAVEKQELQFQLQLQQLDASRETAREHARQRELEFQRTLLELERDKAEADGNAAGVETANRGLSQLDAAIADQEKAVTASQKREGLTAQVGSNQLRALDARQAGEDVELFRRLRDEVSGLASELGDSKVGDKAQELAEKIGRNAQVVEEQAKQTAQKLNSEITQSSSGGEGRLTNAERKAKNELEKTDGTTNTETELINQAKAAAAAAQAAVGKLDEILTTIPETPIAVTIDNSSGPESKEPQTQPAQVVPSLNVGGVMPVGMAMVHSGELIAPGASTDAAARARLAAGDGYMIQRSGLVHSPTGGYVFTAQKSQQLMSGLTQPSSLMPRGLNVPSPVGGASLSGIDLSELSGLSGEQLAELRSLNRNINQVVGQGKSQARVGRHQRYKSG